MKRKVSRIGPSSLMVSLPSRWVKKYGIKKGDELDVEENDNMLSIFSGEIKKSIEKATINLDDLNTSLVWYKMMGAYRAGVEEITLRFNKDSIKESKLNKNIPIFDFIQILVNEYIGMEIIKSGDNFCTIKEISSIKKDEFNNIQRRIFHSLVNMFDHLISNSKNKESFIKFLDYHDKNINRLSDYCIRVLSKTDSSNGMLNTLILQLEEIGDALKYLPNISSVKDKELNDLKELFLLTQKFYYSGSQKYLLEFENNKRKLKKNKSFINILELFAGIIAVRIFMDF